VRASNKALLKNMGNSQGVNEDVVSGVIVKEAYDNFSRTIAHPDHLGVLKTVNKGIWQM